MSEEKTEKTKYCISCDKDVVPESRKEYMGWLLGFSIKEKYCPECGRRLTSNTRYAWVSCCLVAFIVVMITFLVGGIQG
jgi:predicted RNA-binding Zn-ribbon protein involved in translation (DUF1610 family)